jgi:DNA-binding protein H-NS
MKSLKTMSIKELRKLIADAQQQLSDREAAEKVQLKERMAAMAAEAGLNLRDLIGEGAKTRRSKMVEIKYQHPRHPELTWTGRGRRPNWLNGARNIERFRVA